VPYELGDPRVSLLDPPISLYAIYVRGQMLIAAHRGREAAAEFQNIIQHRWLVLSEPIHAPAHLGLARAYELQGDIANARSGYQHLLALWKDADTDLPILKQAKLEYQRLKQIGGQPG